MSAACSVKPNWVRVEYGGPFDGSDNYPRYHVTAQLSPGCKYKVTVTGSLKLVQVGADGSATVHGTTGNPNGTITYVIICPDGRNETVIKYIP